jgi:hypothetical protein
MATQKDFKVKNGIIANDDITTTGHYIADTHFRSSDSNATLSATGGGGVYLRPDGNSNSANQVYIQSGTGNATFSGTITSGAITSSGKLEINQAGNGTSNSPSAVAEFSGQNSGSVLRALSLVNSTTATSGNGTELAFHNASNYSPTGTVRVRQIGDTATDSKMEFQIYRSGLQTALSIDHDSHVNIEQGNLKINGTTVLDSSRNLTNIGTISSGGITSSDSLTITGDDKQIRFTGTGGPYGFEFGDSENNPNFRIYYRTTPNTLTFENNGENAQHTFDLSGNYTNTGDITVGDELVSQSRSEVY